MVEEVTEVSERWNAIIIIVIALWLTSDFIDPFSKLHV